MIPTVKYTVRVQLSITIQRSVYVTLSQPKLDLRQTGGKKNCTARTTTYITTISATIPSLPTVLARAIGTAETQKGLDWRNSFAEPIRSDKSCLVGLAT